MKRNVLILLSVLVIAMFIVGCGSPEEDLAADEDLAEEDIALLSEGSEDDGGAMAGQAVGVPTTVEMGNIVDGKLEITISPGSKGVYKKMWLYFNNKYTAYTGLCTGGSYCFDPLVMTLAPGDFTKSKVTEFVPGSYKIKLYPKDSGRPSSKFFGPFDVVEGAPAPVEAEEEAAPAPVGITCKEKDNYQFYAVENGKESYCGPSYMYCQEGTGCCNFESISTSCASPWDLQNVTKNTCTQVISNDEKECSTGKICYDEDVEAQCYGCGDKICSTPDGNLIIKKGWQNCGSGEEVGKVNGSACPGWIE